MKQIHEDVYNYLITKHNEDKENFFFITRKINRYNKLDEGYWFLGNDNYLAVSFWTGVDTLNRTPRIYFKIKSNGESSIEFRNRDIESHTDFFHPDLIKEIGATKTPNGYSKKLNGTAYIFSLFLFLSNEKLLIDNYINNQKFRDYGASEWADPIEFINPKTFEKQLEIINFYRNRSEPKFAEEGFFKGFSISNFGLLKEISIDIPNNSNWVFLTGENGSGKTSILKAIATGLCQNNDKEERIASKRYYGDFEITILISEDYNKTNTYTIKSKNNFSNKSLLVEGFASYGPVRLLSEGNLDKKILINESKVQDKMTYGLFNPISILKDLSPGYVFKTRPKYYQLTKDSVIGNLEYILPNISRVLEDENGELIFYPFYNNKNKNNKKLTFAQLPSGTRNFVALILDLLIRLQHQQPEVGDISDYKGVVLIDEIDIHLHPKLQIELVKQLASTFPKIQFIVSTHSPVTLLGAPENSIFIKVKNTQDEGITIERLKKLEKEIKYLTPNTILTSDIFDFDFMENMEEEVFENMYLEDNYNDIEKNKELDNRLKNIDKSIFPDDLFKNEGQDGL